MMVFCIGAVGYWLVGFAFQFGAVNFMLPAVNGLAEWAHSPTSLVDWRGLLATSLLQFGQHGILGGSGFALAGLTSGGWNRVQTPITGLLHGAKLQIVAES
jgi:hypothetical protein